MSLFITVPAAAAMLGSALIGGIFFAFSNFIMKALGRVSAAEGINAMQSINIVVLNRVFLGAFIGTAAISLLVIVLAVKGWSEPSSAWYLAGALLYTVGTFLVTVLGNVPLNDQLAAIAATDSLAIRIWEHYRDRWTVLNTVRTIAAIAAALSFIVGLIQ
ncbi:MAG: DUF1772 domain-containing protein [Gammaproteobacteria bacterium]